MSDRPQPVSSTAFSDTGPPAGLRPAFSSNWSAGAFLLLLIFLLILPWLISSSGAISRENSYEIMPENIGDYSFVQHEIFSEKERIDILFLGASVMWNAIDTPFVQKKLSDEVGRPARVVTFGYSFNALDIPYTFLRDLLEQRPVGLVVFSIPRDGNLFGEGPSIPGCRFLSGGGQDDIFEKLPPSSKLALYGCGVLRSPRDVLTLIRRNRSRPSPYAKHLGWDRRVAMLGQDQKPFTRFTPTPPVVPGREMIFRNDERSRFSFIDSSFSLHQDQYLVGVFDLLRSRNVPIVMLNIPQLSEGRMSKMVEYQDWSKRFGDDIPIVGIPPNVLFEGLSDSEVEMLYYEKDHFNLNGSEYFTRTVLPAILEVYKDNEDKGS